MSLVHAKQQAWALSMSHTSSSTAAHGVSSNTDPVRVYAFIVQEPIYCSRANTVSSYIEINREVSIAAYEHMPWDPISTDNKLVQAQADNNKAQLGEGSVIGGNAKIGSSSVKKSTIGSHCKIGDSCKISNSILMDHVTVEDGCELTNTVVCHNVTIQSGSVLKDCRIGPNYTIPPKSEYKAETLCESQK